MTRLSWPRRLLPLIVTQIFLWVTLVLYAFGPWAWPMRNPGAFYAFVAAAHLAVAVGYMSAAHGAPARPVADEKSDRLLRLALWTNLAALPITSYARTGKWVPNFLGGIQDPGAAYADAVQLVEGGTSNAASYVRILLSPWLVALFPLVVFFWGRLNWATRGLAVFVMLFAVMIAVATGTRRDIADLMMTIPLIAIASHWAGVTRFSRRTIVLGAAITTIGFVGFTAFFAYSHVSRVGRETAAFGVNPITRGLPDFNNPMLASLPEEAQPGFIGLVNYATTGYYGLSLALDRDVRPMWGAGHSMFLTRNVVKLGNAPAYEKRSLPVQISDKDGFTYPIFWCTAYPYFANDVGWIGTLLLLVLVGRLLALSWIDMLGGRNPYAVVFFSLAVTLTFYLPATNRILQDGEGVVAFYVWLGVLLLHRARRASP